MPARRLQQNVHMFEHTHARARLHGMYTLNYSRPLMIVVIMCGGKSHFHKVSFSPSLSLFSPLTPVSTLSSPIAAFSSSLRSSLSLPFFSLLSVHISPLFVSPPPSRPHPPPPLLPVVGSSLSPTPSLAPRISSLLHGLASSLSLSPFIYINEQKSSFHLPPDEQTLLVEEDRRKEEQNTEEHSFS